MPKLPDFSKFDLQSIVQSIKSIINPEVSAPSVAEGDPIGDKIVKISTLLKSTVDAHAQSAKDLTKINSLLNELYRDLESFRKLEADLKQKQSETKATPETATGTESSVRQATADTRKDTKTVKEEEAAVNVKPSLHDLDSKKEQKILKEDQSPLKPNEGTSAPSKKD